MKKHIKLLCTLLALVMVLTAVSLTAYYVAEYERSGFKVTFDYAYNNLKETKKIKKNQTVKAPADPQRDGYDFKCWIDETGFDYEFGQSLSMNIVLYARWSRNTNGLQDGMLVIGSGDFDGVFSPFFATAESDIKVADNTQITMLSYDKTGMLKAGEDVPTAVKDYTATTYVIGMSDPDGELGNRLTESEKLNGDKYWTEYEFLIKNGIKFSDGTDLTIKDVLFNMYVYLDPIYNGQNTMNSVNIKGLNYYQRQNSITLDGYIYDEYDWRKGHENYVAQRKDKIFSYFNYDTNGDNGEKQRNDYRNSVKGTQEEKTIIDDVQYVRKEFWDEVVDDYRTAASTDFGSITPNKPFGDTNPYSSEMFTKVWEVFFYMKGLFTVNRNSDGKILDDTRGEQGGGKYDPRDGKWKQIYYNGFENFSHDPLDMIKYVYNSHLGIMGENNGDPTKLDGTEIDWIIDDESYKYAREFYKNDIAKGDYSGLKPYINSLKIINNNYPTYEPATNNGGMEIIDSACLDDTDYIVGRLRNETYGKRVLRNIKSIMNYWLTGQNVTQAWINESISKAYEPDPQTGRFAVETVSGIKVEQVNSFNGKALSADHYVLKVSIVGVDPSAIHKFNFAVAPMKYYSDPTDKSGGFSVWQDGYGNFNYSGVAGYDKDKPIKLGYKQFNIDYFNNVFKDENTIRHPKGAGPYKCDPYDNFLPTVFKANNYFYTTGEKMTNPAIATLSLRAVDTSKLLDTLISKDINYAQVPAKQEYIDIVKNHSYLKGRLVDDLSFGYVGINPKYVQNINIRKIIMTAMDTSMLEEYFGKGLSSVITRSMSTNSWAYPSGETDSYPFISENNVVSMIKEYTDKIGNNIRKTDDGKWQIYEEGQWKQLKYTFTIIGSETYHPAYRMFLEAARILNNNGFIINVIPDPLGRSKLEGGTLTVWAGETYTSIDPDIMFQTYHKDSAASTTAQFGYPYMKANKDSFATELLIIDKLSKYIDQGRTTLDYEKRKTAYKNVLNEIMELAVQYPTYQKKKYIVYNSEQLNTYTLFPLFPGYPDPLYRIWEIEPVK